MKLRMVLFCLIGGLCFMATALGAGKTGGVYLAWSYVSGVVMTAGLAAVARFGSRNYLGQASSIALPLIFIGLVTTLSEAVIFFPQNKMSIPSALTGGSIFYVVAALVLCALARLLKIISPIPAPVEHRPWAAVAPLVLLAGGSYVVYYLIFGGLVFQLYTKQFYPHAAEQVSALGSWFWAYQLGRGVLMVASVVPAILTMRLPRWQAALATGLLVWIVGGGAFLLVPSELMVTSQRYAHIVEIFTQNFALGVTAVLLLRRSGARVTASAKTLSVA